MCSAILGHLACYLMLPMRRLTTWVSIGVLACVAVVAASAEAAPKKKTKKRAPAVEAPKTEETTAEFDRQAAAAAITEVNLSKCKTTNAGTGDGHVMITFAPGGLAQNAVIDKGPWIGTPVAKCMQKEFKKAKVPAFKGDSVTVGKSFRFE